MDMFWEDRVPIRSAHNLSAFLKWLPSSATHQQVRDLQGIIGTVDHRYASDAPSLPVRLHKFGISITLLETPCTAAICSRCLEGKGGYKFYWIGPWTNDYAYPEGRPPREPCVD